MDYQILIYSIASAFVGAIFGVLVYRHRIRKRLIRKSHDRTAESVSAGEFVYIVSSEEYFGKVLRAICR